MRAWFILSARHNTTRTVEFELHREWKDASKRERKQGRASNAVPEARVKRAEAQCQVEKRDRMSGVSLV